MRCNGHAESACDLAQYGFSDARRCWRNLRWRVQKPGLAVFRRVNHHLLTVAIQEHEFLDLALH